MRVMVDPDRCEGHARCVELAPEVFVLDDEGLSRVILEFPSEGLRAKVERAVQLCPRQAIFLSEEMPPEPSVRPQPCPQCRTRRNSPKEVAR